MPELYGLVLGESKGSKAGTVYLGNVVHVNNTAECGGSFYFSVDGNASVKGFWVLEQPQLAAIARIGQVHNMKVRINADVVPFTGPWLKASSVYDMALQTDRGF